MQRGVDCVVRFQSGRLARPRPRTISSCPMQCRQLRLRTDQPPHGIQRYWPERRRDSGHSRKPEVEHHASGIRRIQDVGGGDISGRRYRGHRSPSQGWRCALFVDATMRWSAAHMNPDRRRIALYLYGPSWGFFRHNYRSSEALLNRLTPTQRQIVMPHKPPQILPDV